MNYFRVCGDLYFVLVPVKNPELVLVVGKEAALQIKQVQQRLSFTINLALKIYKKTRLQFKFSDHASEKNMRIDLDLGKLLNFSYFGFKKASALLTEFLGVLNILSNFTSSTGLEFEQVLRFHIF